MPPRMGAWQPERLRYTCLETLTHDDSFYHLRPFRLRQIDPGVSPPGYRWGTDVQRFLHHPQAARGGGRWAKLSFRLPGGFRGDARPRRVSRMGSSVWQLLRDPPWDPRRRPGAPARPGTRHRCARCETIESEDPGSSHGIYPGSIALGSGAKAPRAKRRSR